VLIFNYVQHVHTDEESKFNHARNFVGLINMALFNNGYDSSRSAWHSLERNSGGSEKIQNLIDPSLNERSFWWYILRCSGSVGNGEGVLPVR
jgi:beta-carotene hydroxylase